MLFLLWSFLKFSTYVDLKAIAEPPLWIFDFTFIIFDSQLIKPHNGEKSKEKALTVRNWEQNEI